MRKDSREWVTVIENSSSQDSRRTLRVMKEYHEDEYSLIPTDTILIEVTEDE